MNQALTRDFEDMKERVRKEREAAQQANRVSQDELLLMRYTTALQAINQLTEREVGALQRTGAHVFG